MALEGISKTEGKIVTLSDRHCTTPASRAQLVLPCDHEGLVLEERGAVAVLRGGPLSVLHVRLGQNAAGI